MCPAVNQECGGFHDDAGELGARYPWKRRLGLVFAADLEEVKEVCCRGMNADQVFVRFGDRIWDGCDGEVLRSLIIVSIPYGSHLVLVLHLDILLHLNGAHLSRKRMTRRRCGSED